MSSAEVLWPFTLSLQQQDNVDGVLQQSQNLADILSFAFESPTGISSNNIFLSNRSTDGAETNILATVGTLILEWTRLSDLTGNRTYADLSQTGESYLLNAQPAWAEPFPGLVGTNVNITTDEFVDANGGWNGGTDSYYEYLMKVRSTADIERLGKNLTQGRCSSTTLLVSRLTGTIGSKPQIAPSSTSLRIPRLVQI